MLIMHMSQSILCWLSSESWSRCGVSVDKVSTEMSITCWWGYWLTLNCKLAANRWSVFAHSFPKQWLVVKPTLFTLYFRGLIQIFWWPSVAFCYRSPPHPVVFAFVVWRFPITFVFLYCGLAVPHYICIFISSTMYIKILIFLCKSQL